MHDPLEPQRLDRPRHREHPQARPGPGRREVLALGAGLSLAWLAGRAERRRREPAPDLREGRVVRHVVGLRPYRAGSVRLEREQLAGKLVVHDYGHGGCGLSLSWGSAREALDLAADELARAESALVLGAGAVGLATARLLQERGLAVRLVAAELPPETTSDVAGGLWLPTGIERGSGAAARARFDRVVRRSWRHFEQLAGEGVGVARRRVYDANDSAARGRQLRAYVPGPIVEHARLPLPGPPRRGVHFETWLIEPPRYLAELLARVRSGGAAVERRRLAGPGELAAAPEPVVFNCTGLGSRELLGDGALVPVRGQLVHLEPQELGYLYCDGAAYLFPRSDVLVVGGTFERGDERRTPDPATGRRLLARMRAALGAG